jgi:beta-galactosidase
MKRTLGVCYYPEHWPESQWEEDAARMAALGLTWVRIGEFAWSLMEPVPGQYDWAWLDRAIETLGRHGLQVVLGTPTATPPRWMIERLPDMLAVDKNGATRGFGSRRHYDFSHQGYRAECARIVTAMAERYGKNPHVAAWQTDNEYACHATVLSYSAAALAGFQEWCAQRYQSPQALNRAWGNVFWSMDYARFEDIGLPNLTVTEANPAHVMAFRRYSSDQVVAFNRLQTEIIRKYSSAPIAHNYMGRVTDFDHFKVGADLDIASWDSYPLGFLSDRLPVSAEHKRRFLRQGDPDLQAFHHDLYRAVGRGRWWIMEQQPGPVNWAPYNPDPLPGMARLWAWEAFAHGAEAVCYFRWRQAPFAQETMHAGLLRPDSIAAPAFDEAAQVARELAEMPEQSTAAAPVALVFDYESAWAWQTQPQGRDFDYFLLAFQMYRGLRRLGLNVDIIAPDTPDLSAYRLVLAPGIATFSESLLAALASYNGTALIGPRSNAKTVEFSTPVPLPPNLPGLAATVMRVETLPLEVPVPLSKGGAFQIWREKLETTAEVLEVSDDGFPALIAAGGIHYLAGWPDDQARDRVLLAACTRAGIETDPLPEGLRRRDSATHRFLFNYNPVPVEWDGLTIPPAGVAWQVL